MSSTNFGKILQTAMAEIRQSLTIKYQAARKEAKDAFTDIGKQKELKEEIVSHENEIKRLKGELERLDPVIDFGMREDLQARGIDARYDWKESDVHLALTLEQSPVATNRMEFENIAKRFESMMNLAVGGKEQRNILFQFYTLDWKSLGIDVPCDLDISNIEIKDGKISSDTKKFLA